MASRTQLRLGQITGSFGNAEGKIVDNLDAAATLGAIPAGSGSMVSVMSQFASSIKRIVGGAASNSFTAVAASTLKDAGNTSRITYADGSAAILTGPNGDTELSVTDNGITVAAELDVDGTVDFDISGYVNTIGGAGEITVSDGNAFTLGNAAKDSFFKISAESDNANEKIEVKAANSTNAGSITLESTAGGVFVNVDSASKRFHVDSEGGADLEAVKGIGISNASAAGGDDITITQTGANDSSIIITAAGTGTDAIDINATAGDMLIGKALADGKTLKIGKSGAVEMTIAPHGTPANEKFTLTNTAGTATDSVSLTATAGGIKIDAGLDNVSSLLLTGSGVKIDGSVARGVKIGTSVEGVPITIGHTTSEVTVADNLTVTGDLTVSGVTTTLDTTNLLVEDPIIVLNKANSSANGQGGIAIENGGSSADLVFGRVANDMWGVGTKDTSGGTATTVADMTLTDFAAKGISINSTNFTHALALNGSNLKMGSSGDVEIDPDDGNILFGDGANTIVNIDVAEPKITIHDDANVNDKFEIAVAANGVTTLTTTDADAALANFSVVADGTITLDSAGDIVLDADGQDIFLKDGGTEYGNIRLNVNADGQNGNDIILSASLSNLGLDASQGQIVLMNAGTQFLYLEHSSNDAQIYPAGNGANDIIFQDGAESSNEVFRVDGALQALAMPTQNAAGNNANTGILSFNGNTDVNEAIYGDGGALYLRSNAVNFKLPTADGNAGEVLETDGSGNLSFVNASAGISKRQISVIAALASGSALNPNSATVSNTAPYSRAALDLSSLASNELDNLLDVFVNGQLLISGSDTNVGTGDADYHVSLHSNASQIKFGFDLELDDTVIINKKG